MENNRMKLARLAALPAAVLALSPLSAATDGVAVGATVFGPQGNQVGTIEQVDAQTVIVNTGKHKVPLGHEAFGASDKGPTITVTKAQLDEIVDKQIAEATAKRDAALVAGAAVVSAKSMPLGTVDSVDGDTVILARNDKKVALKREHFGMSDKGLMAFFTVDQIDQTLASQ
jgi:hypothetical protein